MANFYSRVPWRKKDTIWEISTGKPFKVLHVFLDICTLIVDLTSKDEHLNPIVILPRSYDKYCLDRKKPLDELGFSLEPISL